MSYQNIYRRIYKKAYFPIHTEGLKTSEVPVVTWNQWTPMPENMGYSEAARKRLKLLNQIIKKKNLSLSVSPHIQRMVENIQARSIGNSTVFPALLSELERTFGPKKSPNYRYTINQLTGTWHTNPADIAVKQLPVNVSTGASTPATIPPAASSQNNRSISQTVRFPLIFTGRNARSSSAGGFNIPGQTGPSKIQFTVPGSKFNVNDIITPGKGKSLYSFVKTTGSKNIRNSGRFLKVLQRHPKLSALGSILALGGLLEEAMLSEEMLPMHSYRKQRMNLIDSDRVPEVFGEILEIHLNGLFSGL